MSHTGDPLSALQAAKAETMLSSFQRRRQTQNVSLAPAQKHYVQAPSNLEAHCASTQMYKSSLA